MVNDSFVSLACAGLIGLGFGLFLTFAGYRFFLMLLPIWGFVFGFGLGAQTVQALLGDAFLATVTSWVVAFVVGALFAVFSYLFYMAAVVVISGSLGYSLAVGLLGWIGMDLNLIVWLIGIIAAVALAVITVVFNLQKWVIIIATSVLGAGVIFGTFLFMFSPAASFLENPVRTALDQSALLLVLYLVLAVLGILAQYRSTTTYVIEEYSRWE